MSTQTDRDRLKTQFSQDVHVLDRQKGYLSAPSFNLRIQPIVLDTAARLIAAEFSQAEFNIIHGIPHSGNYLATAVALKLPNKARLHASRKGQSIPASWKEIYRREVRSFTSSLDGVDTFSGINLSFVRKGDRVLLIDDVCARGETGFTLISGLLDQGVYVAGFAVMFDKVWQGGLSRIQNLGVKTYSCVRIRSLGPKDQIQFA